MNKPSSFFYFSSHQIIVSHFISNCWKWQSKGCYTSATNWSKGKQQALDAIFLLSFTFSLKYKVGAEKIRLRKPHYASLVALFNLVSVAKEHMPHRKGLYSLEAVQHKLIII